VLTPNYHKGIKALDGHEEVGGACQTQESFVTFVRFITFVVNGTFNTNSIPAGFPRARLAGLAQEEVLASVRRVGKIVASL
jgi:hypothetical protein